MKQWRRNVSIGVAVGLLGSVLHILIFHPVASSLVSDRSTAGFASFVSSMMIAFIIVYVIVARRSGGGIGRLQLYWTLESIPELAARPPDERRQAWTSAVRRSFRHWQVWAAFIGTGAVAAVGGAVGALVGLEYVGGLIGAGIGGLLASEVVTEFARPYLLLPIPLIDRDDSEPSEPRTPA